MKRDSRSRNKQEDSRHKISRSARESTAIDTQVYFVSIFALLNKVSNRTSVRRKDVAMKYCSPAPKA